MYRKTVTVFFLLLAVLFFAFKGAEDTIPAFAVKSNTDGERRVEELIKELYGRGVSFTEEVGDGTVYTKRYYCSNVCIDLLSDGSIRYLSDVNDADSEDSFLRWLYKNGDREILSDSEVYGFILRTVKCGGVRCSMCIDKNDGRVVAARILFNS